MMSLEKDLQLRQGFQSRAHEAVFSIYFTAALIKKFADEFFREYGTTDVQFNVMMLLKYQGEEKNGLTQVELSRMLLVNRANITSLIDRMEKAQIVTRAPIPGDRRYHVVRLTPKGHRMVEEVEEHYMQMVESLMEALNEAEQKSLISFLERTRSRLKKEEAIEAAG